MFLSITLKALRSFTCLIIILKKDSKDLNHWTFVSLIHEWGEPHDWVCLGPSNDRILDIISVSAIQFIALVASELKLIPSDHECPHWIDNQPIATSIHIHTKEHPHRCMNSSRVVQCFFYTPRAAYRKIEGCKGHYDILWLSKQEQSVIHWQCLKLTWGS